jgi:hypothetical protein
MGAGGPAWVWHGTAQGAGSALALLAALGAAGASEVPEGGLGVRRPGCGPRPLRHTAPAHLQRPRGGGGWRRVGLGALGHGTVEVGRPREHRAGAPPRAPLPAGWAALYPRSSSGWRPPNLSRAALQAGRGAAAPGRSARHARAAAGGTPPPGSLLAGQGVRPCAPPGIEGGRSRTAPRTGSLACP